VAPLARDVALPASESEEFLRALSARTPHHELSRVARGWQHRRVGRHLERLAEYASQLGERLGKGKLELHVEGGDLRMPDRFAEFWDELVHVVRNAVDHGMETEAERAASGKAAGVLRLTAASRAGRFVVEISDNGRGIDWTGVRELARKRGLPASSEADLVAALLADGFSTSASVSEISGRGVGMASVRTVCAKLCIGIEAASTAGAGTTFRFAFPEQPLELPERLAVPA
jgi:two-component system chemotaxis sensor kinase CheA